ncbi:flagellar export chaperone FliS [Methyloversatilis thermotolerans]|uniref:flagellar export chaperone FliS n=1 Tax=Methyloversatilis thermotolerans TaxID=1346290 RepID=UPI00035D8D7F|nr:flagellar export chaperone FliS [Methyloversatilis thermotolerans]
MNYDVYQSYHAANLHAQTARATPVQLVLILMDGLLEEIARARAHILAGRYEQKATSLDRCAEMLNGLSSSLDLDAGGEVVSNLAWLYDYCAWRLAEGGIKLDPAMLDEVAGLLETIRHGWTGLVGDHE